MITATKMGASVFICHASEDKDRIVRPLAHALRDAGLVVWYDEFALKLGDSLRQSIERGIASAQCGIVIFSSYFFKKNWPQAELNGLFSINMASGNSIIPVWHDIGETDLLRHAPIFADRFAAKAADGLDRVVTQVLGVIEPNARHHGVLGRLVSVGPSSFRLGAVPWKIKTQVTVANRSVGSVYSVWIKLLPEAGVASEDVEVDVLLSDKRFKAPPGSPPVSGDAFVADWIDAEGRSSVLVVLHTLPTMVARQIIVSGRSARDATVSAAVLDFSSKPMEFMATEGKIAQMLRCPEDGKLKGVRVRIQR